MNASGREGFSLAEALVVLAVTSVLLILLAQVSNGASRQGLRLAARADAVGGRLVGREALRALVRSVRLPERGRSAAPFIGAAEGWSAYAAPGRATPCGDGAPGVVAVRLDSGGGRTRLLCAGPGGRTGLLLDLGPGTAAFSYALAGRPWAERLIAELPPQAAGAAPPPRARLWIRLAAPGGTEVVEAVDAWSGAAAGGRTAAAGTAS